jgi:chemotaxis protein methyltransferase CheR
VDAEAGLKMTVAETFDIELSLLLDAIYLRYHYDFRGYADSSLRRRLRAALIHFDCASLSGLQDRVLRDATLFARLLDYLTVQVSDLFRDPSYFRSVREKVLPVLRTYPSLKVWIAGCSGGEEVYSFAVMLREEGLLERTLIYATDINPQALARAEAGVYALDRIPAFTENHRKAGGKGSLSDHYSAHYGNAVFDKTLRKQVVFSDHSLATDTVFSEVHLVSCRNVLIYFDRALQDRALGLFHEALVRKGFLGLGARESVRFSAHAAAFSDVVKEDRVFQKVGP